MSDKTGESDGSISMANSFDNELNEVENGGEGEDNLMEERGSSNVGQKQLLLSNVGIETKNKKVRIENEVIESNKKEFTFELGASKEGRHITEEEGLQDCISQAKQFILAKKIELIRNSQGEFVVPEEEDESIVQYLSEKQLVTDFNAVYFSAFIQFKTSYEMQELFDVRTLIRVTVRHNYSMTLTTRGGYIGRAHQKYGVKKRYEEILKKVYEEEHAEEVEINVRKTFIGKGVQALGIFIDKEKADKMKETFVKKQEVLIPQGVYVIPTGNFADLHSINYKLNMLDYQKQLNFEEIKSILLYEFSCDQVVHGCEFQHTIKAHLMMLKGKDGLPLFLAVEFVKPLGGTSRGMVHFLSKDEAEVVDLIGCVNFWNKVKIMQPSLKMKKMFNTLPPTAIECKENWNFTDTPVQDVIQDMVAINKSQDKHKGKPSYADKVAGGVSTVPEKKVFDQWLVRAREDAKALVSEVEKKVKMVESKVEAVVTTGRVLSQKVEQQEIKVEQVLKIANEHTERITNQGEEIAEIKKDQKELKETVMSVKTEVTSIKTDTSAGNNKFDQLMKFLIKTNMTVNEETVAGVEKVANSKKDGDKEGSGSQN